MCLCPILGSVRWASKERQVFRQNFRTKGKEFAELKKDVSLTWCYHTFYVIRCGIFLVKVCTLVENYYTCAFLRKFIISDAPVFLCWYHDNVFFILKHSGSRY